MLVRAPAPPVEAMRRLAAASKRGKLPGFERRAETEFRALVYGEPFDREVVGRVRPEGEGSVIALELRLMKKIPAIAIVTVIITIWPGVWLTDSLIQTYFASYPNEFWITAAWYLPITVLPLPWILRKVWRKSEAVACEELGKTMTRIARAVSGEIKE